MSGARETILGAIRQALKGGQAAAAGAMEGPAARLEAHPWGTIPARSRVEGDGLAALFVDKAGQVNATVECVDELQAVPAAVARYLARENLPAVVRAAPVPLLETLDWEGQSALTVSFGRSEGADAVGLTDAFAGIAETGTLMLISGSSRPTTLNFLPDTHLVVLMESRLVGAYEAAWDRLRDTGAMPRTVNLITGPSRTADIEQTILLGAHGPRRLHILLVKEAGKA